MLSSSQTNLLYISKKYLQNNSYKKQYKKVIKIAKDLTSESVIITTKNVNENASSTNYILGSFTEIILHLFETARLLVVESVVKSYQ